MPPPRASGKGVEHSMGLGGSQKGGQGSAFMGDFHFTKGGVRFGCHTNW